MIRLGTSKDIARVNALRKQVNDLHVAGEPSVFKPGFCKEMQDYLKEYIDSDQKLLLVYEEDGVIYGYAMLEEILKPETPYRYELHYLEVGELGVDESKKGKGYGKLLMQEVQNIARQKGLKRIELNMWTFNEGAYKFYEKLGYKTYRRHLRLDI